MTEDKITLDFINEQFKQEWLEQIQYVKYLNNASRKNSNNNSNQNLSPFNSFVNQKDNRPNLLHKNELNSSRNIL